MSEIASVSAAQRARLVQDALRVRDQQRDDVVAGRLQAFAEAQRRAQIIEQQVQLQKQRLRDKRNDLEFETEVARELAEQQRVNDTIRNDTLFQRNQDQIQIELNASRDAREATENRLLRDLEADRNDALELDALAQRAEDLRQALLDREDRLIERRNAERDAEIRQQEDLQASLARINGQGDGPLRPQDAPRGGVLDVSA